MAFDRSKYKQRVIKQETEVKDTVGSNNFEKTDYAPIINPKDLPSGQVFMNIMPPHNPELDYIQQESKSWLKVMKEDKDGKRELGSKPVFSGEVHSASGRCIIKEYIEKAKALIEAEEIDATEKQNKMNLLYGFYNKTNPKSSVQGITPQSSFPMYVYLSGNPKLPKGEGVYKLMANWTIKNALKEIEVANQEVDQPITVDVFTDPDEGITLVIENTENTGKDKYKVVPRMKRIPVPDSAYEFWEKQRPLDELYVDSYTKRDFSLAMEGLQNFDNEHNFGIFADESFLDIAEELEALYPEPKSDNPKNVPPKAEMTKAEVKAEPLPWENQDAEEEDEPVKLEGKDKDAKIAELKAKYLVKN